MSPSFLVFAAVAALLTAWTILDYVARGASVRRVLIQLLVGIPISLWGGYAFGRTMAWILRVGPGERAA